MNGFAMGIPPGMMGGGPGYQPLAIPATYGPPTPPAPVYTGTDPTIYATDYPFLAPEVPAAAPPPVWFDPYAPLDTTGLNFPDAPVAPPAISSPPMIFNWETPLDFTWLSSPSVGPYTPEPITEGLVFPFVSAPALELSEYPGIRAEDPVWFDWQAPLITEGLVFPDEPRTGPLESIWKFAGDVIKGAGDVAKFIFDKLDVSVGYRGDFGGVKTQKAYYTTTGAPAPVILGMPGGVAPSVRTSVTRRRRCAGKDGC